MRCTRCSKTAISTKQALCKKHYAVWFEREVARTIRHYKLFSKRERVAVACSGGKDSTALLHLLQKLGYMVTAVAIDEGIHPYRDENLTFLKEYCTTNAVPLRVFSFKEAFGKDLDVMLPRGGPPCTVCGTFRRSLLDKVAHAFDVVATGHNADDEAQAVLMNLARANLDLFPRGGPVTTSNASGFVRRVKPFYFLTEKEILTYALLRGIAGEWNECPYASQAYRTTIRDALNAYEEQHPGTKRKVLAHYLRVKEGLQVEEKGTVTCVSCGAPSARGFCKACRFKSKI